MHIHLLHRDPVPLVGYALKTPIIKENQTKTITSSLNWCINTILKTTPVTSVHIISNNNFLAKGGVIGVNDDRVDFLVKNSDNMPILQKVLKLYEEIYLPDLQVGFLFYFLLFFSLFFFVFFVSLFRCS